MGLAGTAATWLRLGIAPATVPACPSYAPRFAARVAQTGQVPATGSDHPDWVKARVRVGGTLQRRSDWARSARPSESKNHVQARGNFRLKYSGPASACTTDTFTSAWEERVARGGQATRASRRRGAGGVVRVGDSRRISWSPSHSLEEQYESRVPELHPDPQSTGYRMRRSAFLLGSGAAHGSGPFASTRR